MSCGSGVVGGVVVSGGGGSLLQQESHNGVRSTALLVDGRGSRDSSQKSPMQKQQEFFGCVHLVHLSSGGLGFTVDVAVPNLDLGTVGRVPTVAAAVSPVGAVREVDVAAMIIASLLVGSAAVCEQVSYFLSVDF